MTPHCYNHPPFTGQWVRNGYRNLRPVLRWQPFVFEQRCAAWDGPDSDSPAPERLGWACGGCRWQPERAVDAPNPRHFKWCGLKDLDGSVAMIMGADSFFSVPLGHIPSRWDDDSVDFDGREIAVATNPGDKL